MTDTNYTLKKVTRVEIIDYGNSPSYPLVYHTGSADNVMVSVQDDGRTLKVFIHAPDSWIHATDGMPLAKGQE